MYLQIGVTLDVLAPNGRMKQVSVGTRRVQVDGSDTVRDLEHKMLAEVDEWKNLNELPLNGKATLIIRG